MNQQPHTRQRRHWWCNPVLRQELQTCTATTLLGKAIIFYHSTTGERKLREFTKGLGFLAPCLNTALCEETHRSIRAFSHAWTIMLHASCSGSGQENHKENKTAFYILKGGKITVLHVRSHVSTKPKTTPTFLVTYAYSHSHSSLLVQQRDFHLHKMDIKFSCSLKNLLVSIPRTQALDNSWSAHLYLKPSNCKPNLAI